MQILSSNVPLYQNITMYGTSDREKGHRDSAALGPNAMTDYRHSVPFS